MAFENEGVVTLSHDGFARCYVVRRREHVSENATCHWCGKSARFLKGGGARLFQYGWESEGVRPRRNWSDGLFCSKGCHDAYHA